LIFAAVNVAADLIFSEGKMSFGQILTSAVTGAVGGMIGGGKLISVGQTFLSAGVSQINRLMPSIPIIESKGFNLGLSPMIAYGTNGFSGGATLNASGVIEGVAYGASVGIGYNSGMNSLGERSGGSAYWNKAGFLGYNDGHANYGIGLSTNEFSGKTAQGIAAITLQVGDFGLRVDEDYLGDKEDRYRTGAVLATYKVNDNLTLAYGISMLTGDANDDHTVAGGNPKFPVGKGMYDNNYEIMPNLRAGIMYGGVIYKGQATFAGSNSEKRLHDVQNYLHRRKPILTPYFPDKYLPSKFYGHYGSYHSSYLFY
jgi:hypothetical protein